MEFSVTVMKWFPRHERREYRRFWRGEKEEIFDALRAGGCENIGKPAIEVVNTRASMRVEFTASTRPDFEGIAVKIKKIPHAYGYSEAGTIFGRWDEKEQMFVAQAVHVKD